MRIRFTATDKPARRGDERVVVVDKPDGAEVVVKRPAAKKPRREPKR